MSELAGDSRPLPKATAGHPGGLYVLFGSEMWERFSYYGMRALLVLYLTKQLNYARKDALALYALYTGLVYVTPLIGGYLADKVLGQRKAIFVGGIVMALGHFAMAFESALFLAISLLILGNGFFKPNISTMVGNLYPPNDARRDGAYTIFYMGINLGAFFSPLACGFLADSYGWHYGFGAAGVGMILGLISFAAFQRLLVGGFPPDTKEERLVVRDWVHVVLVSLICCAVAYGFALALPTLQPYTKRLIQAIGVAFAAAMAYVLVQSGVKNGSAEGDDWQRVAVILIVGVFSIVFWMGFEQAGGTLNLFADEKTDRTFYGMLTKPFPASYFQSINPFLIFALAPVFSIFWSWLDSTRFRLPSSAKMGFGLIFLGVGFAIMNQAAKLSGSAMVGPEWLAAVYLFNTLGEICLSPIGLSLVNKLAPAKVSSLMMAVWFLCTAIANYLAGTLEEELAGSKLNLWLFLVATSVIPGLILLAITKPLQKMSKGHL